MPKNKPIPASVTPKVGPWSPLTDADLAKIKVGDVFYSGEVSGQPVMVTILPTTPGGKFGFVHLDDPYGIYQYSQNLMKGDWSITHPDAASNLIDTEYEDAAKAQGLVLAAPKTPKAPKAPKTATPAAIPTAYTAKIGPTKMVGKAGLKKLTVGTVIYGKKYGTPYMITELNADGSAKIIELGSTGAAFSYHQEDIAKHTSLTHPSPGPVDWQKYQDLSHEMNAKIGVAAQPAPAATPAAPATVTVRPIYTEKIGPFKQLSLTELSAVKPGQIIYAGHNTGYPLLIVSVPASPGGDFKVIDLFDPTGAAFTETWAEAKDAWSKQSDNPKAITQTKYEQGIANAGFTMAVKPSATPALATARVPTYKPNIGQWEKAGALAKSLTPGAVVYGQAGTPFILIATPAESAAKEWEFKNVITGKVASYPDGMIGIAGISLQHPNPTQITQDEVKEAFKAVVKPAAVAPPPPAPVVATPTPPSFVAKIGPKEKFKPGHVWTEGQIVYDDDGNVFVIVDSTDPGDLKIKVVNEGHLSAQKGDIVTIPSDALEYSGYRQHPNPKPVDNTLYGHTMVSIGQGQVQAATAAPASAAPTYNPKIGQYQAVTLAELKALKPGDMLFVTENKGTPAIVTSVGPPSGNDKTGIKIVYLDDPSMGEFEVNKSLLSEYSQSHPAPQAINPADYDQVLSQYNITPQPVKAATAPAVPPAGAIPTYTANVGGGKAMGLKQVPKLAPGQIVYYYTSPYIIATKPGDPLNGTWDLVDIESGTTHAMSADDLKAFSKTVKAPYPVAADDFEKAWKLALQGGQIAAPSAALFASTMPGTPPQPKLGNNAPLDPTTMKNMKPGQIVYGTNGYPMMIVGPTAGDPDSWDLMHLANDSGDTFDMKHYQASMFTLEPSAPAAILPTGYQLAVAKAGFTLGPATPAPLAPQIATPTPTATGPVPVASPGMLQKIDAAGKAALIPGRIIYTTTGVPLIVTELISPPGKTGIGIAAISAVDGEEWWIDEDSKMSLYASHDKPKPIDATHYATAQQIIGGGTATAPAPTTPTPPIVAPVQTAPIIQTPVGAFQHKIGPFQPLSFDEIIKFPADTVFYYEVQGGAYHPGIFAGYTAQAKLIDIDDLFDDMPGTYGPGALSLTAPNPVDPDPQTYAKHMGPKIWTKGQPLPWNAIETGAFQGITEGFVPPVGKVVVSLFGTPCVITAPYDPQTKEIEVASLGSGNKVKGLLSDISYGHPSPDWQVVNQQILDDLMAEINAKYAPKVTSQATAAPNVNQVMAQKHYPVPPGLSAANWTKIPEATQKSIWQHIQSIAGTPKKPHGMPQKINTGWPTLSLWEKKTLAAMEAVINGDPTPPAKPSLPKPTDVGNIKWASHQSVVLHEGVFQTYIDDMVGSMATVFPNPQPPGPTPLPPPTVPVTAPLPPPIAQMPTEMKYWEGMSEAITLASTPAAYNAVLAGANAAYEMGVDVDFEAIHREALHITQTTVPMMAALMAESTRNAIQAALLKFQTEGLGKRGLPDLIAELQASASAGFSKDRARKIAVTEVTRLFAEGNRLAALYDDSVGGMQWQAAADELMCPVCGERHMKIYPKSSPPPCPAHVLCRCALIPATWDYIRQNPSAWQGGPIPPAEAQLPEPQAVTAPQIVPPESEAEFPWTEADLTALPRGNIGGGHEKYLYQAPDGSKWLFKPDETAGMAELAAYRMMHYAGLEVPETYFTTMQGKLGTVQRWHKDIKGGVTDATIPSLTPAQIGQTQALHVADWIVSQHDTNQGALLMNQAGGIIAIDKGQAWKFLGKDKLERTYNPNGDRQVWGAFFADYVNGKIDMDRTAAIEQIKKFQAIPEQTMRAILRPLSKQQVKLGAWKSEEDFIETILHRQQNLDADFDKFYTGIEAERRAWDIAHGKVTSKLRADAVTPIDAEFARKVDASGAWGQSILVVGDKIENGNLLAYYVNEGGPNKRRLVIEAKVRPDAEADLLKMCGKTNTGGAVQTEPHYNKLLPAIKHINHHLTDHSSNAANDGKIEESKIGGLTQAAITLKALGSASPIYQHYSTVLQQVTGHSIDQIAGVSTATLHGWVTAHYPDWYKQAGQAANLAEYKAPPPTQPSGPAATILAQDTIPWHLEMKVHDGELVAGAIQVAKKHYPGANKGIEMDLGDGVEAVYTMHSTQNQYSQTGRLQIHLPGWNGDPRQVETILNKMDKLGLDVQLATKADAKLTYLYQMAHTMNLRQNPDYQAEVLDPIKTNNPSVADRTALYKTYLKKHMTPAAYKQLDDESVFMPKYDRTFKNGKRSVEGGWAYWERCDITVADLEREMPGYKLTHSHALSGYTGEAASFIAKCLKTNGTLANTEERVRMDIWVQGQGSSSTADMETGGAMGLFTRIRKSQGDDYDFDKRLLLRTGNYSFDRDRYGKCKEDSYNERYSDIKGWKKIAPNGGNETVTKNSFAMFDWVQTIYVRAADRQRTINMLKAAGIDEVRGKRIEDIVEAR